MPDTIEMKEDGEIESDEGNDEIYKKLDRPQLDIQVNNNSAQVIFHSDSSASSDTDGETPHKKFMKHLEKPPQATTVSASLSKNGSMWKNMLQEETLMETLKTCDVSSSKKRKFERGAESYDFETHRVNQREEEDLSVKLLKRRKMDISGNDSSSSNTSARSNKKWKKNRNRKKPKILADLVASFESSEEDFGHELAQNLEEDKSDLIMKVVSVIGKEASLNLYKITQRIERDGGMLTMNKIRRRTPGGVFLFLLKTSNKIDEDLKKEIFDSQKPSAEKGIAERKMSSEHTEAKDPPNSPANPEFTEINGKITDPEIGNLVSQKILNFTKPNADPPEEVLDLDYNYDDMDTF